MAGRAKYSRRQVVIALTDMLSDGVRVDKVARILANYLVETRQTRDLELYIRDIELMMRRRFGVATVYVYSVHKLNEQTRKDIRELVKTGVVSANEARVKTPKTGVGAGAKNEAKGALGGEMRVKTVELVERIDPEMVGGVIVRMADMELDGSVRTKLRSLRSI